MSSRHRITVLAPCYNEADNVEVLYERVRGVFAALDDYTYEFLFIDNASTDDTVGVLRRLAARDTRVKVIVNTRNFGHIRSRITACCSAAATPSSPWLPICRYPPEFDSGVSRTRREGYKSCWASRAPARNPPRCLRFGSWGTRSSIAVGGQAGPPTAQALVVRPGLRGRHPEPVGPNPVLRGIVSDSWASATLRCRTRNPRTSEGSPRQRIPAVRHRVQDHQPLQGSLRLERHAPGLLVPS